MTDTLRVELYDPSRSEDVSINEIMVLEGYATKCEEPYLSKVIYSIMPPSLSFPTFVHTFSLFLAANVCKW